MPAPHLPPKTCHVKTYHAIKTLPPLLFFIAIAVFTSIAFTLVTVVWVAPTIIPAEIVTTIQNQTRPESAPALGSYTAASLEQMIYQVYDEREKIGTSFYRGGSTLFEFITFSSDGWAVAYYSDYRPGVERYWEAIGSNGLTREIEQVFYDDVSGLLYVKVAGDRFPFVSFSDWSSIREGTVVFARNRQGWQRTKLSLDLTLESGETRPIWDIRKVYETDGTFPPSTILVDERGDLIGMIDADGRVVYGWLIDAQYSSILGGGETSYTAPEWRGYPVVGSIQENGRVLSISGFFVREVGRGGTGTSTVNRGDVIIAIGNEAIDPLDLSRRILLAPSTFTVTVLRDTEELDIIVTKNTLP